MHTFGNLFRSKNDAKLQKNEKTAAEMEKEL